MDPATDDPYQVLGLTTTPSSRPHQPHDAKTVRAAYRRLALLHHPDKQTDDVSRARAHAQFAKISHAYEVLTDPEQQQAWHEAQQTINRQAATNETPRDSYSYPQHSDPPTPQFHDPFAVFESVFRQEFGNGFSNPTISGRGGGGLFGDHNSFFGGADPFWNDPFFHSGGRRYNHGEPSAVRRPDPFDSFFGSSPFFGGGAGFNDMFSSMRQMQEQMRQQQPSLDNNNNHYASYSTTSRTIQRDNGDCVTTTETTRRVNGQAHTTQEVITQRPDGTVIDRQVLEEPGVQPPVAALPSSSSSRPRDATTKDNNNTHKRRRLPWRKTHEEEKKE